jgi:hypothetical protein
MASTDSVKRMRAVVWFLGAYRRQLALGKTVLELCASIQLEMEEAKIMRQMGMDVVDKGVYSIEKVEEICLR